MSCWDEIFCAKSRRRARPGFVGKIRFRASCFGNVGRWRPKARGRSAGQRCFHCHRDITVGLSLPSYKQERVT